MFENIEIHTIPDKKDFLLNLFVLTNNGLKTTKDFVKFFYENTVPLENVNLFILDNGSTDGSVEFLKDFSRTQSNMTLALSKTNLGIIFGRNAQFFLSKEIKISSDYCMYLDNDQFVSSNWLQGHVSLMNKYDIVGVEAWQMNERFIPCLKISDAKQHYCYVGCGGMLIKKKVTDKIGMFDPQFNPCYFEDPDFCFRSYQEGFKIGWNVNPRIVHIPHQTLGKMSSAEKTEKFTSSWKKFRNKWQKFTPPKIILEK